MIYEVLFQIALDLSSWEFKHIIYYGIDNYFWHIYSSGTKFLHHIGQKMLNALL